MRWRLIVLIASLPLIAAQSAHTQEAPLPACAVACSVNPFTAPAGCDCNAPGGEAPPPVEVPAPAAPATDPSGSSEQPAPVEPGVPACQLACSVNPFTAPPGCNCVNIAIGGGGGGTAGPGPSGPSTESVWEDGLLSVGEILDYMEALYRQRIAGVQHYYYLERMVVGQQQAYLPQNGFTFVPVTYTPQTPAQSAAGAQAPIQGVDTLLTVVKELEKVDRDGHPAMKVLTPQEAAQRAVNDAEIMAQASAEEAAAARALANDPSLFFGALAGIAEAFGAGAIGGELESAQVEMQAQLGTEQEDDSLFAEDVVGELMELKQIQDKEVLASIEAGSTGPIDSRRLYLGHYSRESLRFVQGPRCASRVGCSLAEIENYVRSVLGVDPDQIEELAGQSTNPLNTANFLLGNIICIVWRPSVEALEGFQMPSEPLQEETGAGPATINRATAAELWLPISRDLMPQLWGGGSQDPLLGEGNHDRPLRMKVVLASPTPSGFETTVLDRVYDDHHLVETAAGPPLFEPHKIRQEFARGLCPQSTEDPDAILANLLNIFGGNGGQEALTEGCIFDHRFVSDTYRKDFIVNGDWLNPQDKALLASQPW